MSSEGGFDFGLNNADRNEGPFSFCGATEPALLPGRFGAGEVGLPNREPAAPLDAMPDLNSEAGLMVGVNRGFENPGSSPGPDTDSEGPAAEDESGFFGGAGGWPDGEGAGLEPDLGWGLLPLIRRESTSSSLESDGLDGGSGGAGTDEGRAEVDEKDSGCGKEADGSEGGLGGMEETNGLVEEAGGIGRMPGLV